MADPVDLDELDREALRVRFYNFVTVRGVDDCWLWSGASLRDGRGTFWVRPRQVVATRAAWFLAHGDWPPNGVFVCHSCDVPACVNPKHLWLGTNRENGLDASAKKRLQGQRRNVCRLGHPLIQRQATARTSAQRRCLVCAADSRQKWQTNHRDDPKRKDGQRAYAKRRYWQLKSATGEL